MWTPPTLFSWVWLFVMTKALFPILVPDVSTYGSSTSISLTSTMISREPGIDRVTWARRNRFWQEFEGGYWFCRLCCIEDGIWVVGRSLCFHLGYLSWCLLHCPLDENLDSATAAVWPDGVYEPGAAHLWEKTFRLEAYGEVLRWPLWGFRESG